VEALLNTRAGRIAAVYAIVLIHVVDTSIANVALYSIANDLRFDPYAGQWVVTAFGVGMAAAIPFVPRLTAWLGPRCALSCMLLVSALSIAWCGAADGFQSIVAARAVQGVTSGAVVLLCQRLLLAYVGADRRAFGLGLWTSAIAIAPVLGPFLSATVIHSLSWRWLFIGQLPLLAICAVCIRNEFAVRREGTDPTPSLGLFLCFASTLLAIQLLGERWISPDAVGMPGADTLLVAAIASGAACVWILKRLGQRLFNWSILLRLRFLRPTATGATVNGLALLNGIIYPLWLQTEFGMDILDLAKILAAGGLVAGGLSPLLGRVQRKSSYPLLVLSGLVCIAVSFVCCARLQPGASFAMLMLPRVLLGLGIGLCSPLGYLAVADLHSEQVLEANSLGMFARAILGNMIVLIGADSIGRSASSAYESLVASGFAPGCCGASALEPGTNLVALAQQWSLTAAMHLAYTACALGAAALAAIWVVQIARQSLFTSSIHGSLNAPQKT